MTKTVRKLLGIFLCLCLLLPGFSAWAAGAATGKLEIILEPKPEVGFTTPSDVGFELFKVAAPDGTTATGWGAVDVFAADPDVKGLFEKSVDRDEASLEDFSKKIVKEAGEVISRATPIDAEFVTDPDGSTGLVDIEPGVYYVRRKAGTGSARLKVSDFVVSVSPLKKEQAYTITINKEKYTYEDAGTTSISVQKIWSDKENFDAIRPTEIIVRLFSGDEEIGERYIGVDDEWRTTWDNLPIADGASNLCEYSVTEDVVDGYEGEITTRGVHVKRIWDAGETPKTLYVQLWEDGEPHGAPVVLNSSNEWSHDWYSLTAGHLYTVTAVDPENDPEWVDLDTQNLNISHTFEITNTHTVEDQGWLQISKKVTVDGETPAGKKLNLADGRYYFTLTGPLEKDESYQYYHKDDPMLDEDGNSTFFVTVKDGKVAKSAAIGPLMEGTYIVKEDTSKLPEAMKAIVDELTVKVVPGDMEHPSVPADGAVFENDLTTGSLKITKVVRLADESPINSTVGDGTYEFTVQGPHSFTTVVPVTISRGQPRTVEVTGLAPGKYTVTEDKYVPTNRNFKIKDGSDDGATKTLEVEDDGTIPTVEFEIVNLITTPSPTPTPTPTPTPRSGGGGGGGGTTIIRTPVPDDNTPTPTPPPTPSESVPVTTPPVTETPTPTPTPTVTPTPSPTPTPVTDVTIRKVWVDDGNRHRTRPASIEVQLLRDGVIYRTTTLTGAGNNWSYTFTGLPAVSEDGTPYTYTARELQVPGYDTTLSGTTITNSLIPVPPSAYMDIAGTKTWRDENNVDGVRPLTIVVRLLQDGIEVARRTVSTATEWHYTFENMPVDDGYGNVYTYTIREEAVDDYFTRYHDNDVTNSRLPATPNAAEDFETFTDSGTPLWGFPNTETEVDDLLELFDYKMPLWGEPLKTGDELPLYPLIFGGIGITALAALIVLMAIDKKRKGQNA